MQSPGADESMTGYTRNGVPEMLEGLLGQLVFRALDVIIITEADNAGQGVAPSAAERSADPAPQPLPPTPTPTA